MRDRYCRVWIEKVSGQQKVDEVEEKEFAGVTYFVYGGLDVKFNIVLDASGFVKDGSISVCNLNWETIKFYMSNIALLQWTKRPHIRLEAGYINGKDAAIGWIFEGRVMKTQPTIAPEMWTNFTVMSDELATKHTYAIKSEGKGYIDAALKQLGTAIGFAYDESKNYLAGEKPVGNEKLSSYDRNCSYLEHKRDLEREINQGKSKVRSALVCQMEKGNKKGLYVVDLNDTSNNPLKITSGAVAKISDQNIIGTPQFNWPNMSVTTFLDPTFKCFQRAKLVTNPDNTHERFDEWKKKTFYINRITHSGHLRGGSWTTTLHLIDNSDYSQNASDEVKKG